MDLIKIEYFERIWDIELTAHIPGKIAVKYKSNLLSDCEQCGFSLDMRLAEAIAKFIADRGEGERIPDLETLVSKKMKMGDSITITKMDAYDLYSVVAGPRYSFASSSAHWRG